MGYLLTPQPSGNLHGSYPMARKKDSLPDCPRLLKSIVYCSQFLLLWLLAVALYIVMLLCWLHMYIYNCSAVPLLGIYPDKTIIQKDTCIPMFTAALFTITQSWEQPKCPSTHEWIKKMWYIYTMEYCLTIKKTKTK